MFINEKDNKIIMEKYKEEFFNILAHELKTPLTIIIGYAQLLKEEEFSSKETYLKAVSNIEYESKKLNSIIDELIKKAKQF